MWAVQTLEVEMNISQDQAAILALKHISKARSTDFEDCIKELTTNFKDYIPFDTLPEDGLVYWKLDGNPSDYWFVLMPWLETGRRLQLGGDSEYLAISKATGEISVLTVTGE